MSRIEVYQKRETTPAHLLIINVLPKKR